MTSTETQDFEIQEWLYLGRLLNRNKLTHLWRNADGVEVIYDKLAGTAIGGFYEIRVKQTSVYLDVKYTGRTVNETERALLVAKDQDNRQRNQHRLAEARMAASNTLDDAMYGIEKIAKGCNSYSDVLALQRVVSERIMKAWGH